MNKKLLLVYGLFFGWGKILLNKMIVEQSLEMWKIFLTTVVLVAVFFLIYSNRSFKVDQWHILENTAVCIIVMIVYFFLYQVVPVPFRFLLVIVLLLSIGSMVIMIFASFKSCFEGVLSVVEGIRIMAYLLLVTTGVNILYKMIEYTKLQLIDGFVLFLIICVYYWYFFRIKDKEKTDFVASEVKIPIKLMVLLSSIIFLLALGYGPYLKGIRRLVVEEYTLGYIYILVAYLIGTLCAYKVIALQKQHLEVIMMFFIATIVISYLIYIFLTPCNKYLVLIIIMEFSYGVLHCIVGGLIIIAGYLYGDIYKNLLYILLIAISSLVIGFLLPSLIVGKSTLNLLITLICLVIAMALMMFLRKVILTEFDLVVEQLKEKENQKERLTNITLYKVLTPREKEVLNYLILKLTNKEIAERLEISENTLKKHCKNIYGKLNISNKKELKELVTKIG